MTDLYHHRSISFLCGIPDRPDIAMIVSLVVPGDETKTDGCVEGQYLHINWHSRGSLAISIAEK